MGANENAGGGQHTAKGEKGRFGEAAGGHGAGRSVYVLALADLELSLLLLYKFPGSRTDFTLNQPC